MGVFTAARIRPQVIASIECGGGLTAFAAHGGNLEKITHEGEGHGGCGNVQVGAGEIGVL